MWSPCHCAKGVRWTKDKRYPSFVLQQGNDSISCTRWKSGNTSPRRMRCCNVNRPHWHFWASPISHTSPERTHWSWDQVPFHCQSLSKTSQERGNGQLPLQNRKQDVLTLFKPHGSQFITNSASLCWVNLAVNVTYRKHPSLNSCNSPQTQISKYTGVLK